MRAAEGREVFCNQQLVPVIKTGNRKIKTAQHISERNHTSFIWLYFSTRPNIKHLSELLVIDLSLNELDQGVIPPPSKENMFNPNWLLHKQRADSSIKWWRNETCEQIKEKKSCLWGFFKRLSSYNFSFSRTWKIDKHLCCNRPRWSHHVARYSVKS